MIAFKALLWLRRLKSRPTLSPEVLGALAIIVLALGYNIAFWRVALAGREPWSVSTLGFALGTFVLLVGLQYIPLMLLGIGRLLRPLLMVLFLVAAAAQYFSLHYGVVLDTDMLRNALHTDTREAGEYLSWDLLVWMMGFAVLPAMVLAWVRIPRRSWRKALSRRSAAVLGAAVLMVLAGSVIYQDLSSVARNRSELRFAVTPLSPLWSTGRALWREHRQATLVRAAPEPAVRTVQASGARKPLMLVLVVGETARAASFSLLGYGRPTNPELIRENLIVFRNMQACGTATAISLPCMFSSFGRARYNEAQIRSHDSALQVLETAGLKVTWVDNQSGCKRVCEGLTYVEAFRQAPASQCDGSECFDEVLLSAMDRVQMTPIRDQVVVLHQLGNHGPAYHRRYPPAFERFRPACRSDEFSDCSREEIVNAYDNAILYTDHVLALLVHRLRALQPRYDTAMIYLSDHGESLGEHGLYLHGMPYFLAPKEQLEVPMLWWLPSATATAMGLDSACLARRTHEPASHDNLYHTLLGMLQVQAPSYRSTLDLSAVCRDNGKAAVARVG